MNSSSKITSLLAAVASVLLPSCMQSFSLQQRHSSKSGTVETVETRSTAPSLGGMFAGMFVVNIGGSLVGGGQGPVRVFSDVPLGCRVVQQRGRPPMVCDRRGNMMGQYQPRQRIQDYGYSGGGRRPCPSQGGYGPRPMPNSGGYGPRPMPPGFNPERGQNWDRNGRGYSPQGGYPLPHPSGYMPLPMPM